MKKIINSKIYNTETAKSIASYRAGLGKGDFRNYEEILYKTAKGVFFLAGSGGPMTKYSEPCGNMTGGGSGIIPLTKEGALSWLEGHAFTDEIERYFSDLIEEA